MIIGHNLENNKAIGIDIQRVIDGRLLFQANSGGGKSYALRKFCEITHEKVQQIIIDVEGEFGSLRDKFDYILVGKDGDIPINLRASELLAKRLLELNASAIIDLYELKHHERKRFVKTFLDSLINSPKELWHPCLIIIDECHIFAPEKSSGEAESLDSIKDLATRGRKRGFALVAATQRLSKLSKDVVAELNTKLIGRSSLDVDMKRAAFELGFTDKKDILSLRSMNKGEFYAFGPALTSEVTKIKIDKVITTHPEAGKTYHKTKSAPADKIKKVLEKLKDLPMEAEEELKTKEDLKRKINELIIENRTLKHKKPVEEKQIINKEILNKWYENGFNQAIKQTNDRLPNIIQSIKLALKDISIIKHDIEPTIKNLYENLSYLQGSVESLKTSEKIIDIVKKPSEFFPIIEKQKQKIEIVDIASIRQEGKLRGGAMKMLKAVAMYHPNQVSKNRVATLSGFSVSGGTFNIYLSELKRINWINIQGDHITITEEGLQNVGQIESLSTDSNTLIEMWCGKFRDGVGKMLRVITSCYPNSITKIELGEQTGFTPSGGTFNIYLSELRRNGLVQINGEEIIATKELFPLEISH
jgi:hypothetical protein